MLPVARFTKRESTTRLQIIAGRQGGKTSRVGAFITVFEACRDHGLKPGERAYALLIAPIIKRAQIAFGYIWNFFLTSPLLKNKVVKFRKNEIDLDNGITIACYPCSQITIRGLRVVVAILDEVGLWRDEVTAANPAQDVLIALRPAMATFAIHKLIKISTPYRKEGVLWRDYNERAERRLSGLATVLSRNESNPIFRLSRERTAA